MMHSQPPSNPAANGFSAPRLDIASRRKRPRPAALQPEAQRSVSYGPMTLSPTARMPSLGIAKQASVRRIKSTGNGLNAGNGRIQKPGVAAAPLSPRNFHSLSSNTFLNQNAHTTNTSSQNITPLTPLSPLAAKQQDPAWLAHWLINRTMQRQRHSTLKHTSRHHQSHPTRLGSSRRLPTLLPKPRTTGLLNLHPLNRPPSSIRRRCHPAISLT